MINNKQARILRSVVDHVTEALVNFNEAAANSSPTYAIGQWGKSAIFAEYIVNHAKSIRWHVENEDGDGLEGALDAIRDRLSWWTPCESTSLYAREQATQELKALRKLEKVVKDMLNAA